MLLKNIYYENNLYAHLFSIMFFFILLHGFDKY